MTTQTRSSKPSEARRDRVTPWSQHEARNTSTVYRIASGAWLAGVSLRPAFGGALLALLAFCTSCAPAAIITSWQIGTTQCKSPIMGCSALNDWDTPETHTFQSNLQPAYVTMGIDWSAASTGDWTRADAQINLNGGYKIIVEIAREGLTSNNVGSAVVAICGRYSNTVYCIDPYTEPEISPVGATNYSRFFNAARDAINANGFKGIVRLGGPATANSVIGGYTASLTNLIGGVTNIDVILAHDYFAAPGNGIPSTNNQPYLHVIDGYGVNFPLPTIGGVTLADRLIEMNRWQIMTGRTNDRPVMSEYGLYDSDVQDAIDAARAFKTNNVACVVWAANIPVHSAIPIGHQLPGLLWSKAMTEFMKEICR